MFILLRVVAYYVKCFNMLFLFNQGPYWKQVLFYALYMLSFNKTIKKKKKKKKNANANAHSNEVYAFECAFAFVTTLIYVCLSGDY